MLCPADPGGSVWGGQAVPLHWAWAGPTGRLVEDCLFTFHSRHQMLPPPVLYSEHCCHCVCVGWKLGCQWRLTGVGLSSLFPNTNQLQRQSSGNVILGPRLKYWDLRFAGLYLTSNCCFSAVLPSSDTARPFHSAILAIP